MNYKELIDVVKGVIEEHPMVSEYGYGELSDISTPTDELPPDYPYCFINPISIDLGVRTSVFNFNLIVMTQTEEEMDEVIEGQDMCFYILKDLISRVNYIFDETTLYKFNLPSILTPFKERFDDDVVGFTATLTIEYSNPLNACDRPNTYDL